MSKSSSSQFIFLPIIIIGGLLTQSFKMTELYDHGTAISIIIFIVLPIFHLVYIHQHLIPQDSRKLLESFNYDSCKHLRRTQFSATVVSMVGHTGSPFVAGSTALVSAFKALSTPCVATEIMPVLPPFLQVAGIHCLRKEWTSIACFTCWVCVGLPHARI